MAKPKLSRASTHKVRTGCITCKRRHIKCDEAKPHCSNCLRARGHCEGYASEVRSNSSGPVQIRWDSRQGGGRGAAPRTIMSQLLVDPDSVDFQNAAAMGYFQEFVGLVQGPWINAASNNDLWEVTMPQLARSNDVLRSAALAIGALSMWHRQSGRRSLRAVSAPASLKAEGETHYYHAVAYYCHSIKLQSQKASLQDAVFLSLLLLFFERLRGNRKAALDHLNHGLTLLFVLFAGNNVHVHVPSPAPNPNPLLRAVADIFTYLATQVRTTLRGRIGQGPSLPNLTRELQNQKYTMESLMLLLSELPRSVEAIGQMPTFFDSLDQFKKYWSAAGRRRQTKMISIMAEAIQSSSIQYSKDQGAINEFFFELLGNPRIKEFCEDSRKQMQKLDAAFSPLFNQIMMSDTKSPAYLRAIHFRLQYLASYVVEDPTQYLDIERLRSQTAFFREFLSLVEIAIRATEQAIGNPAHQLSLQCGLSWYLLLIVLFCRDPSTRDEAVWILRDYPGQDGLWNTHSLYILALRNRDIERANAVEGSPAEQWQRLWRREFVFEDCGSRIVLRYLEKDQRTKKWELIEEVAEVQLKFEDVHWARQPIIGPSGLLMGDLYSV